MKATQRRTANKHKTKEGEKIRPETNKANSRKDKLLKEIGKEKGMKQRQNLQEKTKLEKERKSFTFNHFQ